MASVTKITQLDMFINEKKALENKNKAESERSMKSQIRLLLHTTHEMQMRLSKQEELINCLTDFILEEKPLTQSEQGVGVPIMQMETPSIYRESTIL